VIYGKRIILRRLLEEDWETWYRWICDPQVTAYMNPGLGVPSSALEVKEAIRRYAQSSQDRISFTVTTQEGHPLGVAQFIHLDLWARKAEFAILVGEAEYRGKGYGEEITRLMLQFAFNRLNLHKVWLTVDEDNVPGIRCYEKVGFRHDGILRDEIYKNGRYVNRLIMSILAEEFNASPDSATS